MKVIVVGAGIMGLATAWACRRRGVDVVVYEQGRLPNPRGASVDEHRQMYRAAHGDDNLCLLNDAAYAAWNLLWRDLGRCLFEANGMLLLSRAPGDIADASEPSLRRLGFACERLEPAALAARYPQLDGSGVRFGILEQAGGTLYASRIVSALAEHLRRHGAVIHQDARVTATDAAGTAVSLADGRRDQADQIVVACGAWSTLLVKELRGRSTPSRRVLLYLDPPARARAQWARSPGVVHGALGIYFVPPTGGTGLKVGFHRSGAGGDPDAAREVPDAEAAELLARVVPLLAGGRDYRIARPHACFYQMSADDRFIVERVAGAWCLTGFSGHGFALGPYIGCKVAQALCGEIDPLAVTRLMRGEAVSAEVREAL